MLMDVKKKKKADGMVLMDDTDAGMAVLEDSLATAAVSTTWLTARWCAARNAN
jgi:hypothetical protein